MFKRYRSACACVVAAFVACIALEASAELTQGSKYIVVGGSGDQSLASDTNGGAYTGSVTWSQFQGANGAAVATASGAAITDNGSGMVRVNAVGAFSAAMADIYAFCDFDGSYADGRYNVTAVDAAGNYVDLDLAYSSSALVDINVGGALAVPQTAVDMVDQGDWVKISGGPYTDAPNGSNIISCTVAVETGGSPIFDAIWNTITIEGVSSDGEMRFDDKVLLDCGPNSIGTAIDVASFYRIRNFEITGNTSSAIGRNGVDNVLVEGCYIHDCRSGLYLDNHATVTRCVIENTSSRGVYADNNLKLIGCVFNANAADSVRCYYGEIMYCSFTAASSNITLLDVPGGSNSTVVMGNTFYGADLSGVVALDFSSIDSGYPIVMNNIFANCDTAMSADSDVNRTAIVYNNLYYGNVSDVAASGNITVGINACFGDPDFVDPAGGDLNLGGNSAAIASGFDSSTIQALSQGIYDYQPTGDVKIMAVGGSGDCSGASDTNGGAYIASVNWDDFQDANGGPLDSVTSATVESTPDSKVRVTANGKFINSIAGVYAWCDFSWTYTDGRYLVTYVEPSGNYVELDLDYIDSDSADIRIGGALASPQMAMDMAGQGDVVKIAGGPYTHSDGSSIIECVTSVTSPSSTNAITVEGVNADGVVDWGDKVVLDCSVESLGTGIAMLPNYRIRNFEIIGASGRGLGDTGVDTILIEQCIARDCGSTGLQSDNGGYFIGCESYDNSGWGIDGDGAVRVIGCVTSDNYNAEVYMNYGMVVGSTISNYTGADQLVRMSEQWTQPWYVVNNTLDGGGQSGVIAMTLGQNLASTAPFMIFNNCVVNCEEGIYCTSDMTRQSFFYNNLFDGNVYDVTPNGNADAGYDAVFADPMFVDPASGDYTLASGSPALADGFDANWTISGDSGMAIGASGLDIGAYQYIDASLKLGDANGDNEVNLDDFIILKQNYGLSGASWGQGDFNGDGTVNLDDFIILKQNYGS